MKISTAVWLDRDSARSLQIQLAQQVRKLIESGTLRGGEPMPSSRDLASQLKVARNTVVYAYDQLLGEGYLEAQPRKGVFVSSSIDSIHNFKARKEHLPPASPRVFSEEVRPSLSLPAPFRPSQPDVTLFPMQMWNRFRGQVLRNDGGHLLHYQEKCRMGYPPLRQAIADYLKANRGVHCDFRQIAVTTGSQQALYLLSQMLLDKSSRVYMEEPGYIGAQLAWRSAGSAIDLAHLDDEGMLPPGKGAPDYTLIYTTPSRQFPVGVSLSLRRRHGLLRYAEQARSWIVEDDYDSEFRYSAPPLPSLQSLDVANRVIYLGTFSKLLFPSLRIGYVVLPPALVDDFAVRRAIMDDQGPIIDQATLARFMDSGAFLTHIRRCRSAYGERQSLFLDHVKKKELPFTFKYTDGGMNLLAFLPAGESDREWSERCRALRFDIPPLSRYAMQESPPGLVFGFTAFNTAIAIKSLDKIERFLALR